MNLREKNLVIKNAWIALGQMPYFFCCRLRYDRNVHTPISAFLTNLLGYKVGVADFKYNGVRPKLIK